MNSTGYETSPVFSSPFHRTLAEVLYQLRRERHEALTYALAMYRREHGAHPRNPQRAEWAAARVYWTTRAFHLQGEIMARLDTWY